MIKLKFDYENKMNPMDSSNPFGSKAPSIDIYLKIRNIRFPKKFDYELLKTLH